MHLVQKTKDPLLERAVLVAIQSHKQMRWEVEDFLDELALLADTAGAQVVVRIIQDKKNIDAAYFIGKGKAEELKELVKKLKIDLVIFDEDLSGAQVRNLENILGIKVIDRSWLILDIFAKRAKTKEAKTQVELAQLQYLLPRLTRRWTHLSRQVGGIGTRGPGETQIEVDRRLIKKRISTLSSEIEKIQKQRDTRRKARKDLFKIALVGYTNAGKSTLLNILTPAAAQVENRLFVTLDPTIRALDLDGNARVLLIDTVGFIRKLPHHLIASFHSTLEEITTADLLVHVVDVHHSMFMQQISSVNLVLEELKISDKPVITVFNKIDLLDDKTIITRLRGKYEPVVFISAAKGYFLQEFVDRIKNIINREILNINWVIKSGLDEVLPEVSHLGIILDLDQSNGDFHLKFRISRTNLIKLKHRIKSVESMIVT